jgi:hypothetical protein
MVELYGIFPDRRSETEFERVHHFSHGTNHIPRIIFLRVVNLLLPCIPYFPDSHYFGHVIESE